MVSILGIWKTDREQSRQQMSLDDSIPSLFFNCVTIGDLLLWESQWARVAIVAVLAFVISVVRDNTNAYCVPCILTALLLHLQP